MSDVVEEALRRSSVPVERITAVMMVITYDAADGSSRLVCSSHGESWQPRDKFAMVKMFEIWSHNDLTRITTTWMP